MRGITRNMCFVPAALVTLLTVSAMMAIIPGNVALSQEFTTVPVTEHVNYIDRDGDGYGVAAPNGPDADDRDPTVNTYESALAKYGS